MLTLEAEMSPRIVGLESQDLQDLQKKMLSLSLKYQRNYSDAEDVAAETMLTIVKNYQDFEGRSKFNTWAYRICVNKNLEFLRKKKTIQEHLKTMVHETWYKLQGVSEEGFSPLKEDFQKALSQLDDRERDVFILTVFEELAQKEIADILDLSLSNVKVILHRGRKKLMNELSPYLDARKSK